MLVQLKQSEIEAAIKQYITHQGINLTGKNVEITFTATRVGGGGIVSTIDIEEGLKLPRLYEEEEQSTRAPLALVASNLLPPSVATAEMLAEPQEEVIGVAEEAPSKKTTSLFS